MRFPLIFLVKQILFIYIVFHKKKGANKMKAIITGGTKNIIKETVVDMEAVKEKMIKEMEENQKEEPAKAEQEDPDTSYSNCAEIKNIRDIIDTVVIYQFDTNSSAIKKYKVIDVNGFRRWGSGKHRVIFTLENHQQMVTSDQEGEMHYHDLWLSKEDDDLAIKLFRESYKRKIKEVKKEIERLENLSNRDWKWK